MSNQVDEQLKHFSITIKFSFNNLALLLIISDLLVNTRNGNT